MAEVLKVAVAGLGTVGAGLVRLLQAQHDVIAARAGRAIEITAVAARDKGKDRGCDLGGYAWYENAAEMARDADADVVVELIGGSDGIAKETCEAAFAAGRHVVTANKALIAHHGLQLAGAAEQAGVTLAYEAAVAGGIPVVKSIREGLAGNRISSLHGILNGTCNYILTAMRESGRDFEDVLSEAQALGYAEADPSFDVDGVDAAHKLAILTSLAFGVEIDFESVSVEGIRHITPDDLQYAREIGYKIKLLGIAEQAEQGVFQRVHPVMVPMSAPIASVEGVFNAVVTKGDFVDTTVMEGRGAGDGPTASAVAADLIDIAAGRGGPAFGVPVSALRKMPTLPLDSRVGTYYVRLVVIDQPGVMADITAILRDESISLENVIQRGRDPGAPVTVVLTTHDAAEAAMQAACAKIEALGAVVETPRMIRIELFEE